MFQWLNFRVPNSNDSWALTLQVMGGRHALLRDPDNPNLSTKCYERRKISTGKSAVRCDVGLGFTVHHPVLAESKKGMAMKQSRRMFLGMRAWHGRIGEGYGSTKCDYDSSFFHE